MSSNAAPQYYAEYDLHDTSDTTSLPPSYDHSANVHPDDLAEAKKSSEFNDEDPDRAVPGDGKQLDSGSVHLECLKTKDFKYGTRVVARSSLPKGGIQEGEVLYTIATYGAWNWKGATTTFQRGDAQNLDTSSTHKYVPGSATGNGANPPYAELSMLKLRLAESPETGAALEETKRRKFLHSQKWWSA